MKKTDPVATTILSLFVAIMTGITVFTIYGLPSLDDMHCNPRIDYAYLRLHRYNVSGTNNTYISVELVLSIYNPCKYTVEIYNITVDNYSVSGFASIFIPPETIYNDRFFLILNPAANSTIAPYNSTWRPNTLHDLVIRYRTRYEKAQIQTSILCY